MDSQADELSAIPVSEKDGPDLAGVRSFHRTARFEHRLQTYPHIVENEGLSCDIGVNVVCLKQLPAVRKTLQQKWHKRQLISSGQFEINVLELFGVCPAVIRRESHAYEQYFYFALATGLYDTFQVASGNVQWEASQTIIGTQLHDDDDWFGSVQRFLDTI